MPSFAPDQTPTIVVVGAGISGLATAYHLTRAIPQATIHVLEASQRPGGSVWTERVDGYQVEVGANGFLDNKPSTLELCHELGLGDQLLAASPAAKHRYLFLDDQLHRLPEGVLGFLRTPLLSWRSKLALATERFRHAPPPKEEESVHNFVARRTNVAIAETFADALVTGIYAGDPTLLSAEAAFPRLVAMEREHGSVMAGMKHAAKVRRAAARARGESGKGGSQLRSFRQGLRLLIETLMVKLRQPPRYGTTVQSLARDDQGGWLVQTSDETSNADAVVLSCPAPQQAGIVTRLDADLANAISAIPYSPAVVLALGYRQSDVPHPLDGFGYVMPQRLRGDVLGAQWCSSIFPDRAPAGHVLLRVIAGGWHRPDVVELGDEHLLQALRRHLGIALGIEAQPVFVRVVRWHAAIPQYVLGHVGQVQRIEDLASKHAGLFLTGNAYHGVALNDCTEQARAVADQVESYLRR